MCITQKAGDPARVSIRDDFMFGTVMRNPEICKPFLETILSIKIRKLEYPEGQKTIDLSRSAKSVRLDVYVEGDENTVYDVEMQTGTNRNLPRRSRYYQGMIDLNILNKGQDYSKLKKSIVIFICPFDPFGKAEYIYRFSNYCCLSDGTYYPLRDDTEKVFVNTKGVKGNVSEEFLTLVQYLDEDLAGDDLTEKIDEEVTAVNSNEKWRLDHMTLAMKYLDKLEEGHARGLAEGRAKGLAEGRAEGRAEGALITLCENVRSTMDFFGIDIEKAMTALKVPEDQKDAVRKRVNEQSA